MRTRFIPDWRRNICRESWHASSTPSSETVYSLYSSELQLAGRYDVRLVPSGTRESVPSQESSGSLICEIYLLESLLVKSTRTRPAFALSASFTFSRVETMLVTVAARPADKVRAFFPPVRPPFAFLSVFPSSVFHCLVCARTRVCVRRTTGMFFTRFFPSLYIIKLVFIFTILRSTHPLRNHSSVMYIVRSLFPWIQYVLIDRRWNFLHFSIHRFFFVLSDEHRR